MAANGLLQQAQRGKCQVCGRYHGYHIGRRNPRKNDAMVRQQSGHFAARYRNPQRRIVKTYIITAYQLFTGEQK